MYEIQHRHTYPLPTWNQSINWQNWQFTLFSFRLVFFRSSLMTQRTGTEVLEKRKQIYMTTKKLREIYLTIVFGYIWVLIRHDNRYKRWKHGSHYLIFTAAVKLFISDYLQRVCVCAWSFVCLFLRFLDGGLLLAVCSPRFVANVRFFYCIYWWRVRFIHESRYEYFSVDFHFWYELFVDLGYRTFFIL